MISIDGDSLFFCWSSIVLYVVLVYTCDAVGQASSRGSEAGGAVYPSSPAAIPYSTKKRLTSSQVRSPLRAGSLRLSATTSICHMALRTVKPKNDIDNTCSNNAMGLRGLWGFPADASEIYAGWRGSRCSDACW